MTPIVGDGFRVAANIYRSMILYLSSDDFPGDWTMPEGLYRNGEFVFENSARNSFSGSVRQQNSTSESSTITESHSETSSTASTSNATSNQQQENQSSSNQNHPNTNQTPQPQNPQGQQ